MRDALEHRWRRAGLQLQARAQRAEAERLLVEMDGVARLAEASVRLAHPRSECGGHVALDGGSGDDVAHLRSDLVECLQNRDAGVLERLGRIEDALAGVGLGQRRDCGRHLGGVGPAVDVRSTAQRPGGDEHVVVDAGAADRQRPSGAVGSGVLHTEVLDTEVLGLATGSTAEEVLRAAGQPNSRLGDEFVYCTKTAGGVEKPVNVTFDESGRVSSAE